MIQELLHKKIVLTYRYSRTGNIIRFDLSRNTDTDINRYEITLNGLAETEKFITKYEKQDINTNDFNKLFDIIISLDYKGICLKSDFMDLNCPSLEVYVEYGMSYINFNIPDHERDIEKRGLRDIAGIFDALLERFHTDTLMLYEVMNTKTGDW